MNSVHGALARLDSSEFSQIGNTYRTQYNRRLNGEHATQLPLGYYPPKLLD